LQLLDVHGSWVTNIDALAGSKSLEYLFIQDPPGPDTHAALPVSVMRQRLSYKPAMYLSSASQSH
jgi:hypothetical protein